MVRPLMVLAIALVSLLIASLASPPPAEAAPTVPPIKASQVLATAQGMVDVPYVFGGDDPKKGVDCSAYVSRAWGIARRTTDTIAPVVKTIAKDELMPGDALNWALPGKAGHIRIFDKWATTDKALVWVYEATWPQVVHHVVPYDPRYTPVRRLNIVSDVPMPPPPPLPPRTAKPQPRPTNPGVLAGKVVDEKTGKPLEKVTIFYWTAQEQYRVQSVATDQNGQFKVPRLTEGTYEAAAYLDGYDVEMDGRIVVPSGRTVVVELKLAPAAGAPGTRLKQGTALTPVNNPRPEAPAGAPAALPLDHAIPGGHFFTQTAGRDGISGFAVTNEGGIRFWDEFRRLGGVQRLGYPISQRFTWKGFVVQAMQKGVLQWRPEVGRAWLTNVFDELHDAGKDDWLSGVRSTPPPLPGSFDAGKGWNGIVASRQALLDAQPAIAARYHAAADPMTFFGLPTSRVTDQGNHYAVRLQRAVIQLWKVDVPWAKAGETTVANGADVAKEAGLFPADVLKSERSPLLRD